MTEIPEPVMGYIQDVESGQYRTCKEQKALAKMIRKVFAEEDLIFEEERYEKYMSLLKYFPYEDLYPWEKFIFALWKCTYTKSGKPRFRNVFCMVARGAGKDGFLAFDAACMVSPYNPIRAYDVDICANNEEQAMRPVEDFIDVLEQPKYEAKLKNHFYHTKEVIRGFRNQGKIKGRTNNPKGRDGMRSGQIVFNEIHAYENYANIKVFKTGLGKKAEPREGYFTSNGDVSDGPLDDKLNTAENILFEGHPDNGLLPFVCRLDSKDEIHDEQNWYKANPSLQYTPNILQETRDEYQDWLLHPEQNGDLLTKRMGIRKGYEDIRVTDYEKIKATNKPLPNMKGWRCIVSLDYAEISDFASVNFHFRKGEERYDISHSWLCLRSKDIHRIQAPWQDWAERGLLTLVDDVSIDPELITEYIAEQGKEFRIMCLCMDNFRWTLVSDYFKKLGFDATNKEKVHLIRPSDIMRTDPIIQECFDRERLTWGDNPVLRWATNNTKRIRSAKKAGSDTGNYYYGKIEGKSRKTDPFMAFVAGMVCESVLGSGQPARMPPVGAIVIN